MVAAEIVASPARKAATMTPMSVLRLVFSAASTVGSGVLGFPDIMFGSAPFFGLRAKLPLNESEYAALRLRHLSRTVVIKLSRANVAVPGELLHFFNRSAVLQGVRDGGLLQRVQANAAPPHVVGINPDRPGIFLDRFPNILPLQVFSLKRPPVLIEWPK
jgi:hypothetical protein